MAQKSLETRDSIDTALEGLLIKYSPQKNDSDGDPSWYSQCTEKVLKEWTKGANGTGGVRSKIRNEIVVDIDGTRFDDSMNNDTMGTAWGISIKLCKDYCGRDKLNMVTSFNRLASSSTNYLLPWLALTAQLPYETGSTEADIISVCVGLGSPVLMTFSLMMTILNKRWIRKRFRNLAGKCNGNGFAQMKSRVKSARVIAEEAQQAPTRLLQKDGWLARLVVLDRNTAWWSEAANSLKSTRRGPTLSLYAQLSVAVIAWVLTAMGSLQTKVGDTEEALVLSAGSLWIWLVPVIIGWILVGTQNKKDTVRDAFKSANSRIGVENEETGIEVIDDNSATLADPETRCVNAPPLFTKTRQPGKSLGIFDVDGFQRQQGPVFNYARSISWLNFADRMYLTFEAATDRMKKQKDILTQPDITKDDFVRISADCGLAPDVCNHADGSTGRRQQLRALEEPESHELDEYHSLRGTSPIATSTFTEGPPSHELVEYTSLSEMSPVAMSTFWRHVVFSMLVALALHWGTTGWAIYMSYKTVVKGLGCRSGSYVIYGILATASCAAMLLSAWLSHFAMRGYQNTQKATGYLQLCGAVAVVTRLLGQLLLVCNTVWLLVISIFELIGFFDSCYCAGTQLSKGLDHGWILLFKSPDSLKEDAQDAWGTGIGMGFVTIFLAVMIFYLASRQKPE